jgi:hypothetical protein
LRYYRTTGLTLTQTQELVRRVNEELDEPWNKRTGRPKSLRLYKAVEAACRYLRQNATQEFIGDTRDTSQPTISRYTAALVPLVKAVLEEFVPDAADAGLAVSGAGLVRGAARTGRVAAGLAGFRAAARGPVTRTSGAAVMVTEPAGVKPAGPGGSLAGPRRPGRPR